MGRVSKDGGTLSSRGHPSRLAVLAPQDEGSDEAYRVAIMNMRGNGSSTVPSGIVR